MIGSLGACKLSTLKALSRGSNFKVHNAKFVRIESGLDIAKFMKGGSDLKIETVYLEA